MHEDLLRHIWSRQLFDTSRLITTDGREVRILDPGMLSRKSGPDFRNAIIRISDVTFSGDIEFHRTFDDWNLHNHQNDQNYNSVILHVVVSGKAPNTPLQSGRIIPTIVLQTYLFSPIENIEDQLSREEYSSKTQAIKCASVNDPLEAGVLNEWINTLYRERLQEKVRRLHERLCDIIVSLQRTVGEPHPPYNDMIDDIPIPQGNINRELFKQKIVWEQLLYEEVMDGLGYSNNRVPMKKLSGIVPLISLIDAAERITLVPIQLEAILFKASGLLPPIDDVHDQDSKVYIHSLNTAWNELPQKIALSPLHHTEWNFSPTRPSNFPTVRIAAAAAFLHNLLYHTLFKSIITIVSGQFSTQETKIEQLQALFRAEEHPFWVHHYSFSEPAQERHALLGTSRSLDIIVNTIVPFVGLYAGVFGKENIFEHCLNMAVKLPLLEENAILRTMNKQMVKGKIKINAAYQQQALIQLNKRYCAAERCDQCEIGKNIFKEYPRNL
jgi:hypothetical protein